MLILTIDINVIHLIGVHGKVTGYSAIAAPVTEVHLIDSCCQTIHNIVCQFSRDVSAL